VAKKDIIVIGGSAGSHSALRQIMAGLPADIPASIFVATHVPTTSAGYLADALASAGPLPVSKAIDGQPVKRGRVYVAAIDRPQGSGRIYEARAAEYGGYARVPREATVAAHDALASYPDVA
jgi:chemotaxis response regulator CheB